MDNKCFSDILFVLSILDILSQLVSNVNGHSQAFIQIDNELRYLVDGVSVHMYESISADGTPSRASSDVDKQPSIRFDPPMLDFKEHPLGMPHVERVMIYNPSAEHTISMLSISGSTVHFHCTFFQEKMIPPLGNTSLDVVFLGREVAVVESHLYIHSSVGSFKFKVKAEGTPNPYRLKPLVGVKMPLNSSYSPLIEMYNPHKTPLQVLEMYSSGGDLHLELPTGDVEGLRSQWEVPPYHSRPVMRASFVARQENNHTAFIRIKTNSSDPSDDYLVVPVEVEVSAQPGLFCPLQRLDFGLLAAGSQPRVLWLPLLNAAQKPIQLQHVVASPANDAIEIDFEPIRIPPTTGRATNVAKITFYPDRVRSEKQLSGKIFIKSKSNQHKMQMAYSADLVAGDLSVDAAQLQFHVSSEPSAEVRRVSVTNRLAVPLAVYNVSLTPAATAYLKVSWSGPTVLERNASTVLFTLTLHAPEPELQLSTHLVLHTNVTELRLPVTCYTGKLRTYVVTSDGGPEVSAVLDFGTLGVGESRDMHYYLLNENPIPVQLHGWGSNLSHSVVELVGTGRGGVAEVLQRHGTPYKEKHLLLEPHHYAVMRVGIVSPDREGLFVATAFVHTEYEQPTATFRLRVAMGSLSTQPQHISFERTFPGKTSSVPLSVYSAFGHAMTVSSVRAEPADRRLVYRPASTRVPVVLEPQKKTSLGQLSFEPARGCGDDCYTGFQLSSKRGARWLQGLSLPANIGDVDSALFHSQYTKYRAAVAAGGGGDWHNISVTLDTSEVRGYQFWARAQLSWPQLVGRRRLRFGVTQVGNVTVRDLTLENPSELPLAVHVSLLSDYPATQATMDIIQQLLGESPAGQRQPRPAVTCFTLLDAGRPEWTVSPQPEPTHAPPPHPDTVTAVVPAGGRLRVALVFLPHQDAAVSDILIIRNNLTVLDMLVIQGRGAYGQLKFGNHRPGSSSPLLFELTEKHLKDCSRRSAKYLPPNFTVKRAFTTRNVGDVPISISNFSINGLPCEGYGFRVLNCQPFVLQPNSSRKVELAFTPDFTMSVVRRSLELNTSLLPHHRPLVYGLLASVPAHMLLNCAHAVPRPEWEALLYYAAVTFMIFMLFSILAAAFFESDRILKDTFDLRPPPVVHLLRPKVFDLRRIGDVAVDDGAPAAPAPPPAPCKPTESKKASSKPTTPPAAARVRREPREEAAKARARAEKAADESDAVQRRRRQLRKEAKSQRSWASTIMESLGMNAAADVPTVMEDVRPSAERPTPPRASAAAAEKRADNDDDDSISSTTDNSNVEDVCDKDNNKVVKVDRDRGNKSNKTGQSNIRVLEKPDQTQSSVEPNAKSKPVKKTKAKVTNSLHNMGSLELPYKPKTVEDKKDKKKQRSKATVVVAPAGTVSPSSSVSSEAAPPLWDAPSSAGADEAFDLLAQQTENFARGTGLPARTSFANIVSGQGDRQKTRAPPVGKIAPEVKQPAASLGPIGPPQRPPTLSPGLGSVWSAASDLCSPPPPLQAAVKPLPPVEEPSSFGLRSLWSWSSSAPPQQQQPTFMQSLQADRRLKVHQYEQRLQHQQPPPGSMHEWPGFGSSAPFPATADLWESPMAVARDAGQWCGGGGGEHAWSPAAADPARPPPAMAAAFGAAAAAAADPWAPRAAADSGWPNIFPADEPKGSQ